MEAIVLVGGLGTRLGELTKETPKPMLPIRGVPFLKRLLVHLKSSGFTKAILAVGYKHEVVQLYFSDYLDDIPSIEYSIENNPLGTGGAIEHAMHLVTCKDVFVLNGDSFLELDYFKMYQTHITANADITIASFFINPADRYGVMTVGKNSEVLIFQEKGVAREGLINGGVYLLNVDKIKNTFSSVQKSSFSFEDLVLSNRLLNLKKYHFQTDGYFLDIGVPVDYERAQRELFK